MKRYTLHYASGVYKDLHALERTTARRIVQKLEKYIESPDPLATAKPLSGKLSGFYRYRVGDYRIIFEVDEQAVVTVLVILHIMHRKDIYR
ncbi:MAG: type II toxin-antitoxin system RelE/ParE family toxin [Candidatus Pacebacteria bacterium]|jgi:mRNA interferase RelE/StbE|nr:type II toxin-antitoxin system RelE/ParE family toxin [Candidatus Paceibacterota bacterium]